MLQSEQSENEEIEEDFIHSLIEDFLSRCDKYKHNINIEYLLLHRETKFKELVAFTFTSLHLGKLIYINEKRNV